MHFDMRRMGRLSFWSGATYPRSFVISVTDSGPGIPNLSEILDGKYVSRTGLGKGIIGTRRLMDHFEITSSPDGTMVEAGKSLPLTAAPLVDADRVRRIVKRIGPKRRHRPFRRS